MSERNPLSRADRGAAELDALAQARSAKPSLPLSPALVTIRGDQISPRAVSWLWRHWLALGKLHVLAGAPGTGKTTLSMALAATITTGGRWPDGSRCERGSVLVWSGEDDPADVLATRLLAMGADMKRVHFITGLRDGTGIERGFDPASDMPALADAFIADPAIKMMIVDPLVSAVTADSHKNAEVRRGLQPLVDLAQRQGCALLGISHFSKGTQGRDPTERVTGSLAFGALARVVLATAKRTEPDGRTSRLLARSKSNIGPDDGGFAYEIQQVQLPGASGIVASAVQWGEAITGSARELLAAADEPNGEGEGGALADAKAWLADCLASAPILQSEVMNLAAADGHSKATIRRAKDALGVKSIKGGMGARWRWALPGEGAHENAKVLTPKVWTPSGNGEHLRDGDAGTFEGEV